MPVIGIRQLCRQTGEVFEELERTGTPVVIARHGKPIAALIQVNESQLSELVLAAAPEFVDSRDEADAALTRGDVQPMSKVIAEMAEADTRGQTAEPDTDTLVQLVGLTIGMPEYEQVIESISRAAVESAPIEFGADEAERINNLNEELTRTVFAGAMLTATVAAVERMRLLSERLAARAAQAEAPAASYAEMLDHVAEVEQLSVPSGIVSASVPT